MKAVDSYGVYTMLNMAVYYTNSDCLVSPANFVLHIKSAKTIIHISFSAWMRHICTYEDNSNTFKFI